MSSINTLPSSGYYQLSNNSTNAGNNNSTGSANNSSATNALLQALNGTSTNSGASNNDAYLLDLSPQAQQYINSANASSASSANESSFSASGNSSFVLSKAQQQQITDIISKYKDAPYTQDTFNQIQNDLNAVGLGAEQMAQKDQTKNFNPTQLLIAYLNGDFSAADAISKPDETGKTNSYMQGIMSQWKNISTTANATTSTAQTGVPATTSASGA